MCPSSGFYCPGALQDVVNDIGGSKPIIIALGQTTQQVSVTRVDQVVKGTVVTSLSIDQVRNHHV